jgi:hypothetical protein
MSELKIALSRTETLSSLPTGQAPIASATIGLPAGNVFGGPPHSTPFFHGFIVSVSEDQMDGMIASQRRGEKEGASLDDMAKKYGL